MAAVVLALVNLLAPAALSQFQYQRLKSFGYPEQSGASPNDLLLGSDGALYGTTATGGANNGGTAFRLNKDGSGYATSHAFTGTDGGGRIPAAALIEGTDGFLYGTTLEGGSGGQGTVFRLAKDGSSHAVLRSFAYPDQPEAALLEASDAALYGTTRSGLVFCLTKDGTAYRLLLSLAGSDQMPSGLVEGRDGALYGRTYSGGAFARGMVFRLNKDGSDYRVLGSLGGPFAEPSGVLVSDPSGGLYGTTRLGGTNRAGTVFQLRPDGSDYAVTYTFNGSGWIEGHVPEAPLLLGSDGALYGTTTYGGGHPSSSYRDTGGVGTIFKVNRDGSGYHLLHSFEGQYLTDAGHRQHALIEGRDGALYGTTELGGTPGCGTVFTLGKDGTGFRTLHDFLPENDGVAPLAEVCQGADGALYGTTSSGGPSLDGTVFRLNPDGSGYLILHWLGSSQMDGADPRAAVVEGSDGALYGTTEYGGTHGGGTVFKLNKDAPACLGRRCAHPLQQYARLDSPARARQRGGGRLAAPRPPGRARQRCGRVPRRGATSHRRLLSDRGTLS